MADRKKLDLQLNQPCTIELLYDKPTVGSSQYGEYYLYAVKNGNGATEYSFFASPDVHDKLRALKKGDKAIITKQAEQKGSKIITKYDIQLINQPQQPSEKTTQTSSQDNYFAIMLGSYEDAIKIQEKLGIVDLHKIAISLFIARSKVSNYGLGG